jgi:hypothetical protein
MKETPPPRPIREIKCVRRCGYIRPYTDSPEWKMRIIDHPHYGPVSNEHLVELEVFDHNCDTWLEARDRARSKIRR